VRLAVKALRQAIALRKPFPGCVFHTDRGSQYASEMHRDLLEEHGFVGSMSRRGNPYDNPQAESFMKTPKVEDAYQMEYETFDDVADGVPASPSRPVTRFSPIIARGPPRSWCRNRAPSRPIDGSTSPERDCSRASSPRACFPVLGHFSIDRLVAVMGCSRCRETSAVRLSALTTACT